MPLTKKHKKASHVLGIELPFGWCLVRGEELRKFQRQLREAQLTAALRGRMCRQFLEKLNRKEAR